MSTFDGIVEEFPQIRIDYFRTNPRFPPPRACFLSHVHSDHLQGLESLKSPFVYCSPATREILLRLEKYPHRMNFAKGILETRLQHYKHLNKLLKTIPLETPTVVELAPGNELQVTLFDANHCVGAVMFLIEGDGKAILYTGDVRSESWWVNSVVRNPILVPYTMGSRRLDRIYLDTTFATAQKPYRSFPSKAEGLKELFEKVDQYPADMVFHFNAWTFGYEDVWVALSAHLKSQVHVDNYKMRLYNSLTFSMKDRVAPQEGPALSGFICGNRFQPGCLTKSQDSRLHSCEKGTSCSGRENNDIVYITPIIHRLGEGLEMPEVGAGGGVGDLKQNHELELSDDSSFEQLMNLFGDLEDDEDLDPVALDRLKSLLFKARNSSHKSLSIDALAWQNEDMSLDNLLELLYDLAEKEEDLVLVKIAPSRSRVLPSRGDRLKLPRTITFPYSRHSSYEELCLLVEAFHPKDIYPCTVDREKWHEGLSMRALFGRFCSANIFRHDLTMIEMLKSRKTRANESAESSPISYDENSGSQSSEKGDEYLEGDTTLVEEDASLAVGQLATGKRLMPDCNDQPLKSPRLLFAAADGLPLPSRKVSRVHSLQESRRRTTADAACQTESVSSSGQAGSESNNTGASNRRNCSQTKPREYPYEPYKCKWLHCASAHTSLASLAHHINTSHNIAVTQQGVQLYGCLWQSCSSDRIQYFGSESSWIEHMRSHSGLNVSDVFDYSSAEVSQNALCSVPVARGDGDESNSVSRVRGLVGFETTTPREQRVHPHLASDVPLARHAAANNAANSADADPDDSDSPDIDSAIRRQEAYDAAIRGDWFALNGNGGTTLISARSHQRMHTHRKRGRSGRDRDDDEADRHGGSQELEHGQELEL
ncbi:MAG: hypothetical protein M1819_000706 [Sarea resinae]|nr:MAG: hypothetical protein M1819_000706 [Sarea resinae]